MTENDIAGYCAVIAAQISKHADDDEKPTAQAAVKLLEGLLIDLNRIAQAASILVKEHMK